MAGVFGQVAARTLFGLRCRTWGDGPTEDPAQWAVSVAWDPGLNIVKRLFHKPDMRALEQLRDKLFAAIRANPGIKVVSHVKY